MNNNKTAMRIIALVIVALLLIGIAAMFIG